MLLQRMKIDDDMGFNYDYMGSTEYEFGATTHGRSGIAKAYIDGDIVAKTIKFIEVHGRSESAPIDVVALCRQATAVKLPSVWKVRTSKEAFRTYNPKIVAWMLVGRSNDRGDDYTFMEEPLFLVRINTSIIEQRINMFFDPFIERIKSI